MMVLVYQNPKKMFLTKLKAFFCTLREEDRDENNNIGINRESSGSAMQLSLQQQWANCKEN